MASWRSRGWRPGSLQVRELAHVDLRREVFADRLLERLGAVEVAAGERPGAGVGLARPLPEERLELPVPYLQHDGEGDVGRMRGGFQL